MVQAALKLAGVFKVRTALDFLLTYGGHHSVRGKDEG